MDKHDRPCARLDGWVLHATPLLCIYTYIRIYLWAAPIPFQFLLPLTPQLHTSRLVVTYYLLPITRYPLSITHHPLRRPKRPSFSSSVVSAGPGALNPQLIQRFIEWQHCSDYNHSSRESIHSSHSLYPTRSYDYPAPPASLSRSLLALLQLGSTLAQVTVSLRLTHLPTTRHFFLFVIQSHGPSRFTPLVWEFAHISSEFGHGGTTTRCGPLSLQEIVPQAKARLETQRGRPTTRRDIENHPGSAKEEESKQR